jgi:D-alanine-D-alanine ligase
MRTRRIAIAHNEVEKEDDASTRDVLAQAGLVSGALTNLGLAHDVVAIGARGVDAAAINGASVVFNLVESPPGRPQFQAEAAADLESLGVKLTGSPAAVIAATTDKVATRDRLRRAGVRVAPGGVLDPERPDLLELVQPPWILKPACEDASLGLDDDAVTSDPATAILRAYELAERFPGQPLLIEHMLDGREFNLSMIAGPEGPRLLPPAEMTFVDYPPGRPRIVGWEAKWDESSFAYRHTVRRFLGADDARLAEELAELATAAWKATGVAGYARVDIRADDAGTLHVLEVNANPCISPDSGFMAAASRSGLAPHEVVGRILVAAGWLQ